VIADYIIYLGSKAVLDEIFLRDLTKGLQKWNKKAIILHDSVKGPLSQTWFQTKRISAHLSEEMILNLPMSAKDLGLFKLNPDLCLNFDKLQNHFKKVQFLVLNGIVLAEKEEKILNIHEIIVEIRNKCGNIPVLTFPLNPLSPLGQTAYLIDNEQDYEKLVQIYPEENQQIDFINALKPVYFVSPQSIKNV